MENIAAPNTLTAPTQYNDKKFRCASISRKSPFVTDLLTDSWFLNRLHLACCPARSQLVIHLDDLLSRDAKSNLNSTDAKLAPQNQHQISFSLKNSHHQADLFGQMSLGSLNPGAFVQIINLMEEAFVPIYITHSVTPKRWKKSGAKSWILLVYKQHYKRDMFCKIKISRYFVIFINDSNITMIYDKLITRFGWWCNIIGLLC